MGYAIKVDGEEIDHADTLAKARRARDTIIYGGIGTEDNTTIERDDRWRVTYVLDVEEESIEVTADNEDGARYQAQRAFGSPIEITKVQKIAPTSDTNPGLTPAQRGEAFTGSEAYAAGRMTHGYITDANFNQVQNEVVHDVIMAAFQAGYLAAGEGTSVDELLRRMAEVDTAPQVVVVADVDPGDRNWWEVDFRVTEQDGTHVGTGQVEVIADDEDDARYHAGLSDEADHSRRAGYHFHTGLVRYLRPGIDRG